MQNDASKKLRTNVGQEFREVMYLFGSHWEVTQRKYA